MNTEVNRHILEDAKLTVGLEADVLREKTNKIKDKIYFITNIKIKNLYLSYFFNFSVYGIEHK